MSASSLQQEGPGIRRLASVCTGPPEVPALSPWQVCHPESCFCYVPEHGEGPRRPKTAKNCLSRCCSRREHAWEE
eukprot:9497122-Pyramimonas_sp.AAC.1